MALDPVLQAKASSMNALMANPDMAKTLFDAHAAPVGSTTQQKGQSILSSVYTNALGQLGGQQADPNSAYGIPQLSVAGDRSATGTPAYKPQSSGAATSKLPELDFGATTSKNFFIKSVDGLMGGSTLGKALQQPGAGPLFDTSRFGLGLSKAADIQKGSITQTTDLLGNTTPDTRPPGIGGSVPGALPFGLAGTTTTPYQYLGAPQQKPMSIAEQWAYIANKGYQHQPPGAPAPLDAATANKPLSQAEAANKVREYMKGGMSFMDAHDKVLTENHVTVSSQEVAAPNAISGATTPIIPSQTTNWAALLPDGTTYHGFDNRDPRGECGTLVNDMTGIGVGNSIQSKIDKIDKTIGTDANPIQVGDCAVFNIGPYGHVGVVNSVNPDGTVTMTEANYHMDGKVTNTRKVSLSDPGSHLVGFGRGTLHPDLTGGPSTGATGSTGFGTDSDLDASSIIGMNNQTRDQWYESLDPAAKAYYQPLYDASNKGLIGDAFALKLLGDKSAMSKLTGVPIEQLKDLPDSGLIGKGLADLWDAKKQEYSVNQLQDSLIQKEAAGLDVKADLESYIRHKDTYLGTVDKMIDDTQTRIDNMDTSNPAINKRMQNYLTYLTVLQGRQNQRYIDYLNTSIQYQSNDVNRTNLLYQQQYQKATDDYNKEAPIMTEEYNNMKTMLSNISTAFENRFNGNSDLLKKQADLANAQLDNAIKTIKLKSDNLDYQNKVLGKPDKVLPGKLDDFRATFFPKDAEYKDSTTGETVKVYKYRDPITVLKDIGDTQQASSGFFQTYADTVRDSLTDSVRSGNFMDTLTQYKQGEKDLYDMSNAYLSMGNEDEANKFADFYQSFRDAESRGLSLGGSATALKNIDAVKTAITNLGKNRYKTENDLHKSKEGQAIGYDVAAALYADFKNAVHAGDSPVKPKDYANHRLSMADKELADGLGATMAALYMTAQ